MKLKVDLLDFENDIEHKDSFLHEKAVHNLLKKILPYDLSTQQLSLKKAKMFLSESLPIIKWSYVDDKKLCLVLLCKQRKNASNFFYDMVSRYLIFKKTLNMELFFSVDFSFDEISNEKYTIMQAVVSLEEEDIKLIENDKRNFETEIRLGIVSEFHANRIREFKGLSNDRKTALVQEKIGSLIQKRPKEFGKNIFSEMQQFLIMSRDEFKSQRDYHHISRIISILYMIRKMLKQSIDAFPDKRHVILKFLKTKLKKSDNSEKTVLGVLVGLNFLKENEVFEKKHLIKAIKNYLPSAKAVESSFFMDKVTKNSIRTCYIEVEKENEGDFTFEELKDLKQQLPIFLKGNIETLIHPIFMPRNEEEIVKNMVVLSHQLKYVHDIPQVIISFDKQTDLDLDFSVILLRVLRPSDSIIKDIVKNASSKFRFIVDRVKKVGVVRRKYLKEASVFRVLLRSKDYLRSDHSVDINKARLDVINELNRLFSEVRDYNGGMIYKQNEAFQSLKSNLGQIGDQNDSLLEKFFYSISPAEMTAIIKIDILKSLFLMLINAIKREETRIKKYDDFLFKFEPKHAYILIPIHNKDKIKIIKEKIECLNILSSELISFNLTSLETPYLGYAYLNEDKNKQKIFFDIIQNSLK
ncbi:MAG: hypothetical protein JXA94_01010 [Parachlamydiales bacterium]|nr:hypothetical protein [Parachlamydiales bacterium]